MTTESFALLESPSRVQELDRLGDEIAELSAHLDAATARLLDLIREFDARGGWNTGFRSCAEWLSWRVGLNLGAARERVRVAHALGALPRLAEALGRGELSYAKVRALTRVATPETEARLLTVARVGTAAHVERIVRAWRRVDRRAEAREAARQHAGRALQVIQDEDGTFVIRGRLTPEAGALLVRALDAARETLYQRTRCAAETSPDDSATAAPTRAQQHADALVVLAETALHQELDPGAPGERYQVVVHVDAAVLEDPVQEGQTALEGGMRVSAETCRRLACDASRVVMRRDPDGRVVEIGARTRTIPPALRRALHHRDRTCRFPGCGVRVAEGHHVQHWASGGLTTLTNLILLCRRHHRAVHEEGYGVEHGADGTFQFKRPDGREVPDVPQPVNLPGNPVEALRAANETRQVGIHARTVCAGWLGERLDLGWTIDVLHPHPESLTAGIGAPD
jgi:5-methylcytosine-specific restriction endonuclease McrA